MHIVHAGKMPIFLIQLQSLQLWESSLVFNVVLRRELAEVGNGKQTPRPFIQCSGPVAPENIRAHLLVLWFFRTTRSQSIMCAVLKQRHEMFNNVVHSVLMQRRSFSLFPIFPK